jgi:hypothetical protein
MKAFMLAAALLALAAKKEPAVEGPEDRLAKEHGGKVWLRPAPLPDPGVDRLVSVLGGEKPGGALTRKDKDAPWTAHIVAVFKKPNVPGPVTVQFFEANGDKDLVDQVSPPMGEASVLFRGSYDLEPDRGFNKGRRYLVKIGQILKGKFVLYASGEVSLD